MCVRTPTLNVSFGLRVQLWFASLKPKPTGLVCSQKKGESAGSIIVVFAAWLMETSHRAANRTPFVVRVYLLVEGEQGFSLQCSGDMHDEGNLPNPSNEDVHEVIAHSLSDRRKTR